MNPLPFDPRSERLHAASEQLTAIAGHPIGFEFDSALLPEYRESFEDALISAIENTARDLRELKERERAAFDHGVPLFLHVD